MEMEQFKEEIRLKLTGGIIHLELDDKALTAVINSSLREVQRYIDTTKFITVPFNKCINLTPYKVNAVVNIYRTNGYLVDQGQLNSGMVDPMQAATWQLLSGIGNLKDFSNGIYNLASWNTLLQIRNTISTDLAYKFDATTNELLINTSSDSPAQITIEYVPRFEDVSEITSDYWIDIIIRLATALTKTVLGRVRSRFTQNNALWSQDGDALLAEGNAELAEIREKLVANSQLSFPID